MGIANAHQAVMMATSIQQNPFILRMFVVKSSEGHDADLSFLDKDLELVGNSFDGEKDMNFLSWKSWETDFSFYFLKYM